MTTKHFVAFAALILGMKGELPEDHRLRFAKETADLFKRINARFDRQRFMVACELPADA